MMLLRSVLAGALFLATVSCSSGGGQDDPAHEGTDAPNSSGSSNAIAFECTDEVDLALTLDSEAVSGSLSSAAAFENDRVFLRTEAGSGQGAAADDAEFEGTFDGSPIEGFRVVLDVGGPAEITVSHDTKAITILGGDLTFEASGPDAISFEGTLASGDGSIETEVAGQATC